MTRYGLSLGDFFHGEQALGERVASRLAPPSLTAAMGAAAATVDGAIDRLRRELATFDPTLAVALDRSARKMRYQLDKVGAQGRP